MTSDELVQAIRARGADLLGVSLTTRQWQQARAMVPEIRQALQIPVVAGGLHPTFASQSVLDQPGFDFVCLGEGEEALLELVTANYMLGLPGETTHDLQQTLELHEQLQPHDFGYFVFYPYPGTRLFHVCREKGYLPENYLDLPANHRRTILHLPDLTAEVIEEYYDRFTALREQTQLKRHDGPLSDEDRPSDFVSEAGQPQLAGAPGFDFAAHAHEAIDMTLSPGEAVAHHPLTAHMSPGNLTQQNRIGYSLTWITGDVCWAPEHAPHPYNYYLRPQAGSLVHGSLFPRFR